VPTALGANPTRRMPMGPGIGIHRLDGRHMTGANFRSTVLLGGIKMAWGYKVSVEADEDLSRMPQKIRQHILHLVRVSAPEPRGKDVIAVSGPEWRGLYRRRIGSYRMFFTVDWERQIVTVVRILIRSNKTYRAVKGHGL